MRTLLFMNIETTGLHTGKDRLVQLSTRLVSPAGSQDYHQLVLPDNASAPATPARIRGTTAQAARTCGINIDQALADLSAQVEQADFIVGHDVFPDLQLIIAEAKRHGQHDLVAMLTYPQFGLDAGRRAAICTRQLAADYLTSIGVIPTPSNTQLGAVYRRLFEEKFVKPHNTMVGTTACQHIYSLLSTFQVEKGVWFPSDVVCFED